MANNVYKQFEISRLIKNEGTFLRRRILTNPTYCRKKLISGICKNRLLLNRMAKAILPRTVRIQEHCAQAEKNKIIANLLNYTFV